MHRIRPIDIRDFLRDHGFNATTIARYPAGIASENFRVAGTGGFDLTIRCDRRRDMSAVVEDRVFSAAAGATGIAVPEGPWLDGEIAGIATTARPTVPGDSIADLGDGALPDPGAIGGLLAAVHRVPPPISSRTFFYSALLDRDHPLWRAIDRARRAFSDDAELRQPIDFACDLLRRQRSAAPDCLTQSESCLIHGDFNPANMLVSGKRITLIDWEKACTAFPDADVIQALYYCSHHYRQHGEVFAAPFLASYRTNGGRPLRSLRSWFDWFPALIFLRDVVSAAEQPAGPHQLVQLMRFGAYLRTQSLPRFVSFTETRLALEAAVQAAELPQ